MVPSARGAQANRRGHNHARVHAPPPRALYPAGLPAFFAPNFSASSAVSGSMSVPLGPGQASRPWPTAAATSYGPTSIRRHPTAPLAPPPMSAHLQNTLIVGFITATTVMRAGTFHTASFLADCISGTYNPAEFCSMLWFASLFIEHPELTRSLKIELQNRTIVFIADLDGRFWSTQLPADDRTYNTFFARTAMPLVQCLTNAAFGILRSSGSPIAAKRFHDELGRVLLKLEVHSRRRQFVPHEPSPTSRGSSSGTAGLESPSLLETVRSNSFSSTTSSSAATLGGGQYALYSTSVGGGSPLSAVPIRHPSSPILLRTPTDWIQWQCALRIYWFVAWPTDSSLSALTGSAPFMPDFDMELEFPVVSDDFDKTTAQTTGPLPRSGLTAVDVIGWMDLSSSNVRAATLKALQTDCWPDIFYASGLVLFGKVVRLSAWLMQNGLGAFQDVALLNPATQQLTEIQRIAVARRDRLFDLVRDLYNIVPDPVQQMDQNCDGANIFLVARELGWSPPHRIWGPINVYHTLHLILCAPPPLTSPPTGWYESQAFVTACSHAISVSASLRSALPHITPLVLSMEPYAILYAAWIHVLAVRRMLEAVDETYDPERLKRESKPFLDMVKDADACLDYLRASGTAGWKHIMSAMDVVARLVGRGGWTEEEQDMVARGNKRGADFEVVLLGEA